MLIDGAYGDKGRDGEGSVGAGRVVSFADEPLILVDAEDRVVGHAPKAACHVSPGRLHRAFSLFLFAPDGRVLLQQRAQNKPLWPGYWANSCCSHPRQGETMGDAVCRRVFEELGVVTQPTYIYRFQYQAQYQDVGAEHELCSVWVAQVGSHDEIAANPTEIAAAQWMTPEALSEALEADAEGLRYTPWLHMEWRALMGAHRQAMRGALGVSS